MEDAMSDDVVSAEKAQQVIDAVNAACELGDMSSTEEAAALTMESLAHTVIALHAREAAQATELAVLRAQLAPLLAVHDALVAAAALPGAGASPEAMVAAVRRKGVADGMAIMHTVVGGVLRILATDDGVAMLLRALEEHREGRPVMLEFDLLAGDAIAKARREGALETTATSFGSIGCEGAPEAAQSIAAKIRAGGV
jgi:hypothetical protein